VTYRLRIARDGSFTNVVVDTTLGSALSFDLTRPLKGAAIFWRVDGRNDIGDSASTPASDHSRCRRGRF